MIGWYNYILREASSVVDWAIYNALQTHVNGEIAAQFFKDNWQTPVTSLSMSVIKVMQRDCQIV